MADRVGVMRRGELVLVEEKAALMRKLGRKKLVLHLATPLDAVPPALARHDLVLAPDGLSLTYPYGEGTGGVAALLVDLGAAGVIPRDLTTSESSLEDIFVDLVGKAA